MAQTDFILRLRRGRAEGLVVHHHAVYVGGPFIRPVAEQAPLLPRKLFPTLVIPVANVILVLDRSIIAVGIRIGRNQLLKCGGGFHVVSLGLQDFSPQELVIIGQFIGSIIFRELL
ncbi:MAG: hypothetical protein BWX80_03959 [Candidatus Hydrogenedentes bacterium ADurb.Bin101]|nr:MAG: hypothetical protein BWX80_03959 [Candidatus Hydrogenedentes bacterium ADurb.Bin101]